MKLLREYWQTYEALAAWDFVGVFFPENRREQKVGTPTCKEEAAIARMQPSNKL
jgi:hypothetical protein